VFTRIGSLGTTTPNASSNFVMVTGAGSTWSSVDDLSVGSDGSGNRLVVTNQGAVFSGRGTLGGASRSSNNTAFVTGFGSVWSISGDLCVGYSGSGSRLAIADRGKVVSFAASVGCNPDSSRNSVWVTGAGSVWSNHFLTVGSQGSGNSLVISNQGAVYDDYGFLGANGQSNGSNNCVRVVDNGLWRNKAELYIGRGVSNELIISGGSVIASNAFISFSDPVFGSGTNNCIRVESGSLFVRNSLGKGALVVSAGGGEGALVLNGGSVTVDQLFLTNGNNSVIAFNGGTLHSKGTTVTNNQQFVVGNSTSLATFHLLGGAHSFNDGLRIRTNSFLTGCGTIHGDVVVDAGGTVRADCGGTLTFTGNVTNNGVMMASNRTVLESSGPLVNNGKILLLNGGTINFYDAFINNGVILNADLGLALERDGNGGFFIRYTGAPDVTYRLQRAARVTGTWSDLATNTAPASGLIEYHETSPPPGKAFYRTVQP
jgi:T5SS/PEP-CTERM-associated repeat protein